ncbi:MAG TPA: HD domain-containing protein [Candidatus Methylomirabilis sp.]|nr:HD domain-containing protein [Candidatus Methylomirabilis sp.]
MIRKALLLKFLDAAYMQRWNDKIRPVELIELDKQAHKMIVAWFLARVEEDRGTKVSWARIIEGGLFELLQRIVITDLKPQIFYKIKADTKKYRQLNEWVYGELRPLVSPLGEPFCRRYQDHFLDREDTVERRILTAAHFYATRWEFLIVERADPDGYEIRDIRADLDAKLAGFGDLKGMGLLSSERRYRNFIDLCGQLRFQYRWAHLHRIPRTSVLGHSLYVAILSYLFSLEIKACPRRCVNNYLTGLFHDLPEVLTRDIISPVKRSVEGLSDLIKGYEKERMDQEVYGLLPEGWHAELEMFAEREFENFATVDGTLTAVPAADLHEKYNEDAFNGKDGELVKRADHLAAFVEAYAGIRNGSTSQDLQYARVKIVAQEQQAQYAGFRFGEIYSDFD